MAITDWPVNERPREKLLQRGSQALSDAELLAIFLRTGCKGKSAVDLARDLLNHFGGLRPLLEAGYLQFCQSYGLGPAKYVQLQAVLEMSRRHLSETLQSRSLLNSSCAVKSFLLAKLGHKTSEVFAVIFLDTQHKMLAFDELFQGTIDCAAVYPREVVKAALAYNASSLILAHNHPSGVAEPSESDCQLTQKLLAALDLVDIRVLDHIVIGDREAVSLAERGLM